MKILMGWLASVIFVASVYAKDPLSAVVFIGVESSPFDDSYGEDPGYYGYIQPFYEFFWPSSYAHGSGFVADQEGHIITNQHVIAGGTSFKVVFAKNGSKIYTAKLVGSDTRADIAVLKIVDEEQVFPYLELGNLDEMSLGDSIFVCGSPTSPRYIAGVTKGVISAFDRNCCGLDCIEGYIQTDAAINRGNSGGPILNSNNEVIGIVEWQLSPVWYAGMGFGIPSHTLKHVSEQLIKYGAVKQGFMGVCFDSEKKDMYGVYYFESHLGAKVNSVIGGSPAEGVLEADDLIVEVNGYPICSPQTLRNRICVLEPETTLNLVVVRNGSTEEIEITLGSEDLTAYHGYLTSEGSYLVF